MPALLVHPSLSAREEGGIFQVADWMPTILSGDRWYCPSLPPPCSCGPHLPTSLLLAGWSQSLGSTTEPHAAMEEKSGEEERLDGGQGRRIEER